jgi:prepilin-type N-terminal cleavage/methylation domain-containing protein/prepilin-type processing-associated H-X9-DG protein
MRKGFTLIELLVVIAIIALLLSIVTPSLRMAKEHARRLMCSTNLKSLGTGLHVYAQTHDNKAIPLANLQGVERHDVAASFQPWFTYNAGLDLGDTHLKPVHLGKLFSEQIVDLPESYYCSTADIGDADEKFNIKTYTTNIVKSMPPGNSNWGSPQEPTLAGRCRINYMYWTWNKNTYSDMSLKPVVVDRLISYSRIAHKKNNVPYGINALFGDGHVNMTLLSGDQELKEMVEGATWSQIAERQDVFLDTLRRLRP